MPINHFKNRPLWTQFPTALAPGDWVQIIEKENQGSTSTDDLVNGQVKRVLSQGKQYRNGAKVELTSGHIGRVQYEGDPSLGLAETISANAYSPSGKNRKK